MKILQGLSALDTGMKVSQKHVH